MGFFSADSKDKLDYWIYFFFVQCTQNISPAIDFCYY